MMKQLKYGTACLLLLPEIDMQRSDRTLHAGKIRNNGQLRIDNYLMLFNWQFSIVNCQLNKFISNNKSIVQ